MSPYTLHSSDGTRRPRDSVMGNRLSTPNGPYFFTTGKNGLRPEVKSFLLRAPTSLITENRGIGKLPYRSQSYRSG